MNYIGSKKTLLEKISEIIFSKIENGKRKTFCEPFAGTGVISIKMKQYFNKVIANDLEYYSYVLLKHYIGLNSKIYPDFEAFDRLKPIKGLIYNYYAKDRMYFTPENAQLIDAYRQYIEQYKDNEPIYFYFLSSLLESADKVANTTSVYAAFLKHYQKNAKKKLIIRPAQYTIGKANDIEIYQEDANELIKKVSGDVLYLDPPYNERQYASNYHVLNTIAKYKEFEPRGVTGLPFDWNRSAYSSRKLAKYALSSLLENANFKHIFISYNNHGILLLDDILKMIEHMGKIETFIFDYKPFKSREISKKHLETKEFLIYLQKIR